MNSVEGAVNWGISRVLFGAIILYAIETWTILPAMDLTTALAVVVGLIVTEKAMASLTRT